MSGAALANPASGASAGRWAPHCAALALAFAALLAIFAADAADMVRIWWTSSTFNHCLIVLPLIAWLCWQRAPVVGATPPGTWPLASLAVAAGALIWLLGEAGGIALLRHAGLVIMLQGSAAALVGRRAAGILAFPILYALFLVPAGEELVPALQHVTAEIAMAMLGLAGISAHIEGIFITTPGGYFEVAEACSGAKFLIAMFALGVLIAHLWFRSWGKRLAFVAACVVVPILANGLRAFATIYVAERSSAAAAADFDHIVYGWFFFAAVMAVLMAAGWKFAEGEGQARAAAQPEREAPRLSLPLTLGLVLSLAAVPVAWSESVGGNGGARKLPMLAPPEIRGWTKIASGSGAPWTPQYVGADLYFVQRYLGPGGQEVDLAVAAYAWQAEGRELVGYGSGAAPAGGAWSWSSMVAPPPGGRADRIVADGMTREVLTFYRVGERLTGSAREVKLETLKTRLLGGGQGAVAVLISGEARGGSPRPVLDRFAADLGVARFAARAAGE